MTVRPKLFIGSSGLAVDSKLLESFQRAVNSDLVPVPWTAEPEFRKGSVSTLEALLAAANKYDFAAFLFTPDDRLIRPSDPTQYYCARDNVVFEYGMFLGTLGTSRVFAYQQSEKNFWVMSDVKGIQLERIAYTDDMGTLYSNVWNATQGLREMARSEGLRRIFLNIATKWKASLQEQFFQVILDPLRMRLARISDYDVCVVARLQDDNIDIEDDTRIFRSAKREIKRDVSESIQLRAEFSGALLPGSSIQGTILLLPRSVQTTDFKNIKEAISLGCRDVQKPDLPNIR